MPVYNAEPYVGQAIDSILQQEFTNFVFFIINDGSVDATGDIIRSYNDPRIRLLDNEHNIGLIHSLNRGLSLVGTRYVARMDADDISLPHRLARQVEFLDAHAEVGVLGSAVEVIDGSGNKRGTRRFPAEHGVLRWQLCFLDPIAHPSVMMRARFVKQVGGYSTHMLHAEDYDLWRRLSRVTRLANLPDVLLRLRRHDACVSHKQDAEQRNNSIRTSQMMMGEVLGRSVPTQLVELVWSRHLRLSSDLRKVARLTHQVCQASVADPGLSGHERRLIRRDAAGKIARLARGQALERPAWDLVALAVRTDPRIVARGISRVARVARERLGA